MAEAAFRQMISATIRQTRPAFRCGHGLHSQRRPLATAAAVQRIEADEPPPRWQPHTLAQQEEHRDRSRLQKLRNDPEPRSFSSFLTDNYARQHNYLRISVTERCNLRCLYCMPEEGVPLSPPAHLLTTPEIVYLSSVFVDQGVDKIRLTGGEPTVRKDIVSLMQQIGQLRSNGLKELCLTTNGISLHRKLDTMVEAGLTAVNLSLDTTDPFQFTLMTRRNGHEAVMKSINRILEMNRLGAGIKLKINCVVMRGINEREIVPFVEMGKEQDLEVRFIEYMPFGGNKWSEKKMMTYQEMLTIIREKYPLVGKAEGHPNDTSKTYKIPGFVGRIGFITSMTDNFCGSCNRLRITSDGNLKVCLFGNTEVSLRDILRESNNGEPIDEHAMEAIKQVEMDRRQGPIGSTGALGLFEREAKLLDVIGMAVKRKKEKHAGMGELEHMENRPMILIDPPCSQTYRHGSSRNLLPRPSFLGTAPRTSTPTYLLSVPPLSHRQHSALISTTPRICTKGTPHQRTPSTSPSTSSSTSPPNQSIPTPSALPPNSSSPSTPQPLTHLTRTGKAHMVRITAKPASTRSATATTLLRFSSPATHPSLTTATLSKGDALAVSRIAGIQAAKLTPQLIPLAHPALPITGASVDIEVFPPSTAPPPAASCPANIDSSSSAATISSAPHPQNPHYKHGAALITATVECHGQTGVEMEALTAASVAGLALYDMLKGVDKGMVLEQGRVVRKRGGKSGGWRWDEGRGEVVRDEGEGEGGAGKK